MPLPEPRPARWRRWSAPLAAAALLAAAGGALLDAAARSSPTWDEVNAFGLGAWYLEVGRFDLPGAYQPPLAAYLAALPLDRARAVATGAFDPLRPGAPAAARLDNDVERGNLLLHRLGLGVFQRTRWPFVAVFLAMGGLVFAWSRRWHGDAGGLVSLALLLACPSLLANGFTATTDLLPAALGFAALYALFLAFEAPGPGPLAAFLGLLALAPTAKLLGLLAAPVAALAVLARAASAPAHDVWVPGRGRRTVGRGAFLAWWLMAGLAALPAGYLALVAAYQGDPALADFRDSVAAVRAQVARGFPVLLDGARSGHGFAAYYLEAIPYKTPTAALLAWALSGLAPGPRRAAAWAPLVGGAALVAALLSCSGFTAGVRYALLAFPLLAVAAGRLAAPPVAPLAPPAAPAPGPPGQGWMRSRPVRLAAGGLLAAAALAEVAPAWPYPRAYVNRLLVRGPPSEALADSDLDWGEGLVALGDFVRARGLTGYALSYHGAAWPHLFGVRPAWYENPLAGAPDPGPRPARGWLFVSATNLSGLPFPDDRYRALRHLAPDAVVGGTIHAYDLDRLAAAGLAPIP